MQKDANIVELEKCCQTHIFLQNFVLIQPRTSPPKNCKILQKQLLSLPFCFEVRVAERKVREERRREEEERTEQLVAAEQDLLEGAALPLQRYLQSNVVRRAFVFDDKYFLYFTCLSFMTFIGGRKSKIDNVF